MRVLGAVSLCALLGACAFSRQVERFGVEYNAALAGMNNEQTLLNILRARDGMPTHFTSVSQFRGTLNLTASASVNGQIRGAGLVDTTVTNSSSTIATTNSTTGVVSATPSTTSVASVVTTPVSGSTITQALTEGVDLFTPQLSGQVVSGTGFDVAVFDTQKFYQGITTAIPLSTVETLLNRGMDNRVVMALMVARVDFRIDVDFVAAGNRRYRKGDPLLSIVNNPASTEDATEFASFLRCYELGSGTIPREETNVVAISRLTRGPANGRPMPLRLDRIPVIDEERFGLSARGGIGSDPANDDDIYLTRVAAARRVARLSPRDPERCKSSGERVAELTEGGITTSFVVPSTPGADAIYLGDGRAAIFDGTAFRPVAVIMDVTFRSPEGLYTYIGSYLRHDRGSRINIDGHPLFEVFEGRERDALAYANYRGRDYSLVNDSVTGTRYAQIFTLLQQLINLHKEANERPTAIPVRAVP